ncbi:hypothetical protein PPERSA_04973 [Pseudocohnilembus persalinus]|uniref:Uncharacterized protein n=1 Tax=Pseudocohnilembus persalinus TaxID=266149 RepID=A0A0V0QWQ6_PSEPJ|nr:hypothetical protein PPERSA_04973 [Pseudocohnilembus persalinus]|eukprot:KRX06360.1 hypothetical protein PPERSA_04973 [Pseudocohnilembus persalinus]
MASNSSTLLAPVPKKSVSLSILQIQKTLKVNNKLQEPKNLQQPIVSSLNQQQQSQSQMNNFSKFNNAILQNKKINQQNGENSVQQRQQVERVVEEKIKNGQQQEQQQQKKLELVSNLNFVQQNKITSNISDSEISQQQKQQCIKQSQQQSQFQNQDLQKHKMKKVENEQEFGHNEGLVNQIHFLRAQNNKNFFEKNEVFNKFEKIGTDDDFFQNLQPLSHQQQQQQQLQIQQDKSQFNKKSYLSQHSKNLNSFNNKIINKNKKNKWNELLMQRLGKQLDTTSFSNVKKEDQNNVNKNFKNSIEFSNKKVKILDTNSSISSSYLMENLETEDSLTEQNCQNLNEINEMIQKKDDPKFDDTDLVQQSLILQIQQQLMVQQTKILMNANFPKNQANKKRDPNALKSSLLAQNNGGCKKNGKQGGVKQVKL